MNNIPLLDTPIEYLQGMGAYRASLMNLELKIFTFRDMIQCFPFRYVDKTQFHRIADVKEDAEDAAVQLRGVLRRLEVVGEARSRRLVGILREETGQSIELVWFQSIMYLEKTLIVGAEYVAYGKLNWFNHKPSLPHPEMEVVSTENTTLANSFEPVYPSTEKLNAKSLDSRARRKMVKIIFDKLQPDVLGECFPDYLMTAYRLMPQYEAFYNIHFPKNQVDLEAARRRLKFQELFFLQLKILKNKVNQRSSVQGYFFERIGEKFNTFYHKHLGFELTGAQKRVLREIRHDVGSSRQMNRLLQGDVGCGKTVVALLAMLIGIDNGYQACMMAPTEILAQQHHEGIAKLCEPLGLTVAFLSGSVKGKRREQLLRQLKNNYINILIGTHAIFEDWVEFDKLGIVIIDEQHRFGVEQRAKLWQKANPLPPHILVMSATPIPRTLAMTLYGDLDVSVIDELPAGRKPIKTVHCYENHRLRIIGFMKDEIAKGRQIYVVYPLIEENEKLDLQNLMSGYEALTNDFPKPEYQISVVHGKMRGEAKDFEMQRFLNKETQIMIATTVIEVGVNVPNASVMVIENTERFGLSQLHQLRGRVGRGAEQSYCILMSAYKLSEEGRERIRVMCATTDGFEIAEADMRLRGPGDIEGTQQSGILNLKIADLAKDQRILHAARDIAQTILEKDPNLMLPENARLKHYLEILEHTAKVWSRIS
jgi:ATP-dependent DNA helicase RecG